MNTSDVSHRASSTRAHTRFRLRFCACVFIFAFCLFSLVNGLFACNNNWKKQNCNHFPRARCRLNGLPSHWWCFHCVALAQPIEFQFLSAFLFHYFIVRSIRFHFVYTRKFIHMGDLSLCDAQILTDIERGVLICWTAAHLQQPQRHTNKIKTLKKKKNDEKRKIKKVVYERACDESRKLIGKYACVCCLYARTLLPAKCSKLTISGVADEQKTPQNT